MILSDSNALRNQWQNTRKKSVRFEILNNAYCPEELILKALYLYPPDEVLDIPAINIKYLFKEFNSRMIINCFSLKELKFDAWGPLGYYENKYKNKNLLFYLEFIYNSSVFRKIECVAQLCNSEYLKRLKVRYPTDFNAMLDFTLRSKQLWSTLLYLHMYSRQAVNIDEILLKDFSSKPNKINNIENNKVRRVVDAWLLIPRFIALAAKEPSKDKAFAILQILYKYFLENPIFSEDYKLYNFFDRYLTKYETFSIKEVSDL